MAAFMEIWARFLEAQLGLTSWQFNLVGRLIRGLDFPRQLDTFRKLVRQ